MVKTKHCSHDPKNGNNSNQNGLQFTEIKFIFVYNTEPVQIEMHLMYNSVSKNPFSNLNSYLNSR